MLFIPNKNNYTLMVVLQDFPASFDDQSHWDELIE